MAPMRMIEDMTHHAVNAGDDLRRRHHFESTKGRAMCGDVALQKKTPEAIRKGIDAKYPPAFKALRYDKTHPTTWHHTKHINPMPASRRIIGRSRAGVSWFRE